jgi:hypothetical protein
MYCEHIPKGECIYCEGKQIIHVDHTNVGVNVGVNLGVNTGKTRIKELMRARMHAA